jgi:hypothetical protein
MTCAFPTDVQNVDDETLLDTPAEAGIPKHCDRGHR